MWVGSNHRYEFPIGDYCTYRLKIKGDLEILYSNLAFYFNSARNMIPNWKEGDVIKFGIVVLPDGHPLRKLIPDLIGSLRLAALFEVQEFLKVPRFQVERSSEDLFMGHLKKNPMIFDKLLAGWEERLPFDKWRSNGMPKGTDRIRKPNIPFFLWGDSDQEIKEAKILYDKAENCVKIKIKDFYDQISKRFSLFGYHSSWIGITNNDVAKELIEYMKFKLGIKPNEE
jgi:hypothetical protein